MAGLRGSPEGPFSGDGEPVAVVQGAAERKPRSDGADDEDRAGREQRVAHADERRYEAAEGEADGAQQRRGRAGVLARAVHGQRGCGREGDAHREEQGEDQHLVEPESAVAGEGCGRGEREEQHAAATEERGALLPAETHGKRRGAHDRQRIGRETEAESEGREAVVLLHDEGRRGDVAEKDALCETQLEDVADEWAVVQYGAESVEQLPPSGVAAARRGQRFAEAQAAGKQHAADGEQDAEDAAPADDVGQGAADDRRRDGRHAVDGTDDGQHAGELRTRETVGGDRTRDDNAAGPGDALQQAQQDELPDVRGEDAEDGRDDEERHGRDQRRTASVAVAQRAEEELPEGQADHARREAQLHHRRRGAEIARHRGERRQVHVRDEGAECREQPQQDEKKGFGIFVVHLFFFPVQKYVAYSASVSSDAAGCSSFSELHLCKPEPGTRMRCYRAACVGLECFADGSGGFHAGASFLGVRARKCSLWGRGVLQGGFSCAAPDLVARGR